MEWVQALIPALRGTRQTELCQAQAIQDYIVSETLSQNNKTRALFCLPWVTADNQLLVAWGTQVPAAQCVPPPSLYPQMF